jgi:dihydrolipoamide dehydrogenase
VEIEEIPSRLLVIGGGIIGLEMARLYSALGSEVTVAEILGSLLAEVDPEIVKPLEERIRKRYAAILLETRVTRIEARAEGLRVLCGGGRPSSGLFDRVLVAVGRTPNGARIGAERAGVRVTSEASSPSTSSGAPTSLTSSQSATSPARRSWRTRPSTRERSPPR